jgi:uncharacterized metal-binding protein
MSDQRDRKSLSLIYSCSGCSSAAQLANTVAVRLDREGHAEMSCIAGVGGGVPSLVKVAKSGRSIGVIDGCALQCARHCLENHGITPDRHYVLNELDVKKIQHGTADPNDVERIYELVKKGLPK